MNPPFQSAITNAMQTFENRFNIKVRNHYFKEQQTYSPFGFGELIIEFGYKKQKVRCLITGQKQYSFRFFNLHNQQRFIDGRYWSGNLGFTGKED